MKTLDTILLYHERTKHHLNHYAASLGYMDWATQPDPFRRYKGARAVQLPLAFENATPPYHLLWEQNAVPKAPLCKESISQLLQFSLSISAYKSANGSSWALRCNASSGNLQPTEGYTILPPLEGIAEHTSIAHYAPYDHSLEILNEFDTSFWSKFPQNSFLISLSSIIWREAWKYGERSFRYTQLDVGHALQALHVSAKMLGWSLSLVDTCELNTVDTLLGFHKQNHFHTVEHEESDMLLLVSQENSVRWQGDLKLLLQANQSTYKSNTTVANTLSSSHHHWEILDGINDATHFTPTSTLPLFPQEPLHGRRQVSKESKKVICNRRSAQMMDATRSQISQEQFQALLQSVWHTKADVHLVLFVHNVQGLQSGLYCYVRDAQDLPTLKENFDANFLWIEVFEHCYLLKRGEYRTIAKKISCSQDIASDGAFSLSMIAKFASVLHESNPQKYKELYYECGAIGQQLYLEATSLELSATGIGCFLDDVMHRLLGLENNNYQSLYHFTIGRAIIDTRIQTHQPYLFR